MVILIAISLPILFTFAALAVDMGFRYTRSRMLQAVADASVTVGMPSLVNKDPTTGGTLATNLAMANGYSGGNAVIDTSVVDQLKVTVKATAPSFFSSLFGGGSTRILTATAVGEVLNHPGPAMLALGDCSSSPGLFLSGNGGLTISGDIESNAPIFISTGGGVTPQTDSGSVQTVCGAPTVVSRSIVYTGAGIQPPAASLFPDPFAADTPAVLGTHCTSGTLTTANDIPGAAWSPTGDPAIFSLAAGVYCSSGDITLSGPGSGFIATNVTLVSMQHVTVGATDTSSLTASPGFPSGIAVYAGASGAGPAINLGSNMLTVNGSIYAPFGLAALSGDAGMTVNGSVIGQDVTVGDSGAWTFNPTGIVVAGNNWRMQR